MDNSTPRSEVPGSDATSAPLDRRLLLGAVGLAGVAALSAGRAKAGGAGPLNPPAGAVVSTGKTLTEVEPRTAINAVNTPGTATALFRISQPGSYYLTGSITGVNGRSGIEIVADDVTIDLMGFRVQGVAGSVYGIATAGVTLSERITIRNGRVSGWGDIGIYLSGGGGTGTGSVIEDVEAIGNGGRGIYTNHHCQVRRCVARGNTGTGIALTSAGIVESCDSSDNGASGITVSGSAHIRGCIAEDNVGGGISGSTGSTIEGCSASNNTTTGILAGSASVVRGCATDNNGTAGINAGGGSVVEACAANSNSGTGITVGTRCVVTGCTAGLNAVHGLGFGSDSLVKDCTAHENLTSGFNSAGTDSRIEGNHATNNQTGINLTNAGNIVIGNTCGSNATNYDLVANNFYGAIINRAGMATAAVNGPSAVSTLATSDPHANFSI